MKIEQVKVYKISLPFLMDISHALTKSVSADNIVVEVIADGGKIKGYGEGTPRKYVTGDSQQEAVRKCPPGNQEQFVPLGTEGSFRYMEFRGRTS